MISCESFMTFLAFEWLFSRVGSLVILQDVFVSKGSVAHAAGEHLLPAAGVPVPAPPPRGWGPGGDRGLGQGLSRGHRALEVKVRRAWAREEASGASWRAKIVSLITGAAGACASPEQLKIKQCLKWYLSLLPIRASTISARSQ